MIIKLISRPKHRLASKKFWTEEENSIPAHPPTAHLWSIGDGHIARKKLLVSGWNVNGYRSVLRKGALSPFMLRLQPDWLCLNETKIDFKGYEKELKK